MSCATVFENERLEGRRPEGLLPAVAGDEVVGEVVVGGGGWKMRTEKVSSLSRIST